ncbi:MAG: hypothetical protein R3217_10520 [Gammaproteobacteria bacterium]|nr:hypothetical protein [Gammaproteobacteria bacterium]
MPSRHAVFLPAILLLGLFLSACGVDEDNNRDPYGLWVGEMKASDGDAAEIAVMAVTADGTAFIWRDDGVFWFRLRTNGRRFSVSHEAVSVAGSTWDGSSSYLTGTLDGTLQEPTDADYPDVTPGSAVDIATGDRVITGSYTLGKEKGSLVFFNAPALSDHIVTPTALAGTWSSSDDPVEALQNVTVIGDDGVFSGVNDAGCAYQGELELPEAGNIMKVTSVSAQCPRYEDVGLNGQLNGGSGVAFMLDTANQYLVMLWVFDWVNYGRAEILVRQ